MCILSDNVVGSSFRSECTGVNIGIADSETHGQDEEVAGSRGH